MSLTKKILDGLEDFANEICAAIHKGSPRRHEMCSCGKCLHANFLPTGHRQMKYVRCVNCGEKVRVKYEP